MPAVEAISLNPILFTQVPNLDTMCAKLAGFIDGVPSWTGTVTQAQVKQTLSKTVLPFLKASTATPPAQQARSTSFTHWPALTTSLAANLTPSALFPLADMWRIALLNAEFAAWNATKQVSESPLQCLMDKAIQTDAPPRNYVLTVLRMLANVFSNQVLAREVILFARPEVTKLLVEALLHDDAAVRTAGASVGFNVAAHLQRLRVDKAKARDDGRRPEESEEWELEMVVAILGAIERETSSEETGACARACDCTVTDAGPNSAPTRGEPGAVASAVAVYGADGGVAGGVADQGGVEGEIRGGRLEEGGPQVGFRSCGEALLAHIIITWLYRRIPQTVMLRLFALNRAPSRTPVSDVSAHTSQCC